MICSKVRIQSNFFKNGVNYVKKSSAFPSEKLVEMQLNHAGHWRGNATFWESSILKQSFKFYPLGNDD